MYKKLYLLLIIIVIISCKEEKKTLGNDNNPTEAKVNELLAKMTLDEKIGQLNLRGTSSRVKGGLSDELKQSVRDGKVGAFLNVMNTEYVDELQRIAVNESPNKVPLIFARDVIHGFKTIFPIPLGLAASWNAETVKESSRVAAVEASSSGIRWTFAPMLDIARDSRWGRIAESPGEDPYLAGVLGKAYVEGFQGDSLNDPTSMIACAKHFIGYGAAIGGRDYNTAIINKELLQNVYLPPFKAAFDAGSQTVMTSFNETNGIPASGDKKLLQDILREQLKFDGFVVSDWNSVIEMIPHGFAKDEKHAAEISVNAGMNMEMTSASYENHIKELLKEGKISEQQINNLVADILRVKFRMGLFENPNRDTNNSGDLYAKSHLELAKKAAIESSVLLKNKENILPLNKEAKVAVIGPLADKPREQLGTWTFDGDKTHTVTPVATFTKAKANFNFIEGLSYSRDVSENEFQKAINTAKKSDVVVFIGGEEAILSGEAHSRANINLPGAQEKLIKKLAATGKKIVLVIMAGRPITLTNIIDDVDAVLMTWHPGTMGGPAIYDMLYGEQEPLGRLPVTWPKTAGQLPLFYNHKNTGRPATSEEFVHIDSIPIGAWQSSLGNTSHYLDAGFTPHFPFGHGLGYTTFEYSDLKLSTQKLTDANTIEATVTVKNTGSKDGSELVQLYVQDVVGSITRPVKELKGFERILLKSGEVKNVSFKIQVEDLKYFNSDLKYGVEKGDFNIWIGKNSAEGLKGSFVYE
ncbi:glycoside hydrolase family 3 N-terminal domain-containing protein [Tenacibaculum sp. M341]|uniref:glycoside hydrolase family 3 N-terminal domain-containing protein n=1 Tax=Tenacibaculum sp. M341 TaxID=2530339 RepID=UPI001FB300B3|nr:glycoside hydrolase family 3 N-terminal domain-containing protein [Tenacibaculum sp. M341]